MAGQAHPGQQARGSRNSRAMPEAVGCLVHQEALKQWQRTAAGLGRESLPAISHWQWLVPGSRLCRGGSPWVENAACIRALSSQAAENQASKAPSQHQRERNIKETGRTHRKQQDPWSEKPVWPLQEPAWRERGCWQPAPSTLQKPWPGAATTPDTKQNNSKNYMR